MTPVEARKTSAARHPATSATSCAVILVDARPCLPVKALALPELTSSAAALPPLRCARHQSTGADGHLDRVNTPATVVPSLKRASRTSVRPAWRIPAATVANRTPSMGGMSGNFAGASGEVGVDKAL